MEQVRYLSWTGSRYFWGKTMTEITYN